MSTATTKAKLKALDRLARLIRICGDNQAIADAMGCSINTVTHRLQAPENFTIGELLKLRDALEISGDDLAKVFGA